MLKRKMIQITSGLMMSAIAVGCGGGPMANTPAALLASGLMKVCVGGKGAACKSSDAEIEEVVAQSAASSPSQAHVAHIPSPEEINALLAGLLDEVGQFENSQTRGLISYDNIDEASYALSLLRIDYLAHTDGETVHLRRDHKLARAGTFSRPNDEIDVIDAESHNETDLGQMLTLERTFSYSRVDGHQYATPVGYSAQGIVGRSAQRWTLTRVSFSSFHPTAIFEEGQVVQTTVGPVYYTEEAVPRGDGSGVDYFTKIGLVVVADKNATTHSAVSLVTLEYRYDVRTSIILKYTK